MFEVSLEQMGVLLLDTSSSGMISLLLDLLLDILNEMLSLTLKSILPTPIECGNIKKSNRYTPNVDILAQPK